MIDALLSKLYKWALIVMIAACLILVLVLAFNKGTIARLENEAEEAKGQVEAAVEVNKAQSATIDRLIAADLEKSKFYADRQQIIEKHYVTERRIEQQSKSIQEERSNADLEDGPISPDLAFVLRRMRVAIETNNAGRADRGSGSPAQD